MSGNQNPTGDCNRLMFSNKERLSVVEAVDAAMTKYDNVISRAVQHVTKNPPKRLKLHRNLTGSTVRSIYDRRDEIRLACLTNPDGVRIREQPTRTTRPANKRRLERTQGGRGAHFHPRWSQKVKRPYRPENIFLGLTVGLFHKTKIGDFQRWSDVSCSEGQNADDRMTIFLCANATGEDKRFVVSGKSAHNQVNYYSEPMSWMTSQVLQCELSKWNLQFQADNREIILFIGAPALNSESNIEVVHYDELSRSDWVKIGMIQCFKCLYRSDPQLRSGSEFEMKIAEWMKIVDDTWKKVPSEYVISSFHKAQVLAGDGGSIWSVEDWATDMVIKEFETNLQENSWRKTELLKMIRAACQRGWVWKRFVEFDDDLATSAMSIPPIDQPAASSSTMTALEESIFGGPSTSRQSSAAGRNAWVKPWEN